VKYNIGNVILWEVFIMALIKCPECGAALTQEMMDVNMCWECGKILDESLLDKDSLNNVVFAGNMIGISVNGTSVNIEKRF